LLSVDPTIFKPSELGSFSPYSNLIDLTKYDNLSHEAKEILYRPPKVKALYEKYWQLVKITEGRIKEEYDKKILVHHFPRYPPKPKAEQEWLAKLLAKVDELASADARELAKLERERQQIIDQAAALGLSSEQIASEAATALGGSKGKKNAKSGASGEESVKARLERLRERIGNSSFYYQGAGTEAIHKWRHTLTEEQK
jgi:hypothetical protein